MPRFATQGSVVITHGSIKHGSLSCAKRQGGDGLAEERGCERPADPRLFPKEGLEGLLPSSKRGMALDRRTRVFFHRHSNWRASRKVAKPVTVPANSQGRWLDVYFAPPFRSPLCCRRRPAQVDGCPDVRSAADGAPQAVDGERSGLAGRCPGLVKRHLALALKFFIAAPQPRNFKASPRVNFVGWVTWDQAFAVRRNTVAGSTKFCRLSTKRCMGRTSTPTTCAARRPKSIALAGSESRLKASSAGFTPTRPRGSNAPYAWRKGATRKATVSSAEHMYHEACLHRG